jgi:hypothetical protein
MIRACLEQLPLLSYAKFRVCAAQLNFAQTLTCDHKPYSVPDHNSPGDRFHIPIYSRTAARLHLHKQQQIKRYLDLFLPTLAIIILNSRIWKIHCLFKNTSDPPHTSIIFHSHKTVLFTMSAGVTTLAATADVNRIEAPVTKKAYFMCAFAAFGKIYMSMNVKFF